VFSLSARNFLGKPPTLVTNDRITLADNQVSNADVCGQGNIPEPSVLALFGFGLLGLGVTGRRKIR
jgi:hypothetical protein